MRIEPKGPLAARLRQRKFQLLPTLTVPADALPGSLSLTHTRCGKPTCRCAEGEGHAGWSLTFMVKGKKRVVRIPDEWVPYVEERVTAGKRFRDAVGEVFAANAELLALSRKQRR